MINLFSDLIDQAERCLTEPVSIARANGHSWAEIAKQCGDQRRCSFGLAWGVRGRSALRVRVHRPAGRGFQGGKEVVVERLGDVVNIPAVVAQDGFLGRDLAHDVNLVRGEPDQLAGHGRGDVDWLSFDRIGLDAACLSGDLTAEAEAEDRIGLAFNALERDEDAIMHIRRAQRLWIEIGNRSRIASSYRRLAFVYKRQGDFDRATDHFARALTTQRELGLTREVGLTLRSIGSTHVSAGRPRIALDYLHESAALLESLPNVDPYNCARTRTTLGLAQAHLGLYDEALENLTVALRNMRSAGSVSGESEVLSRFGEVHERRGDFAEARHYYEQALALLSNLDNPARDRLRAKLRDWPDTPDDKVRPVR